VVITIREEKVLMKNADGLIHFVKNMDTKVVNVVDGFALNALLDQ